MYYMKYTFVYIKYDNKQIDEIPCGRRQLLPIAKKDVNRGYCGGMIIPFA